MKIQWKGKELVALSNGQSGADEDIKQCVIGGTPGDGLWLSSRASSWHVEGSRSHPQHLQLKKRSGSK